MPKNVDAALGPLDSPTTLHRDRRELGPRTTSTGKSSGNGLRPPPRLRAAFTSEAGRLGLLLVSSLPSQGLEQPQDVKLGEATPDEMCLGAFLVLK